MTRVKSLVRLKTLTDELRLRAATTRNIGIEELLSRRDPGFGDRPKVLLVDERQSSSDRVAKMLADKADVDVIADPQVAFFQAADHNYDCIIVSTGFAELRSAAAVLAAPFLDRTRFTPIILLAGEGEEERLARAFELGVNDYLTCARSTGRN